MSRTYKDRPSRVRFPEILPYGYEEPEKTKKRREVNTEWHWMGTPGWWVSEFMNQPERARNRVLERKALFQDPEDVDFPDLGRKPHVYYW